MQPNSFLASLPALLGFAGYRYISFSAAVPRASRLLRKLPRDCGGRRLAAVAPDKRLAPAQVERLLHGNQELQKLVGEQDFLLLQQAL